MVQVLECKVSFNHYWIESYESWLVLDKADLGDGISAMWANEEDDGGACSAMLGCVTIHHHQHAKKCTCEAQLRDIALTSVTTVGNATKTHQNKPAVQEQACGALRIFAPADNYRRYPLPHRVMLHLQSVQCRLTSVTRLSNKKHAPSYYGIFSKMEDQKSSQHVHGHNLDCSMTA